MDILPFVREGLGNSSYLVGLPGGEAALVDPDRSVKRYLDAAAARGWQITRVFETHLHADFVTGSLETAAATGARLFVPTDAAARFPHAPLSGGASVAVPGGAVEAIASPGHAPEHMSYALRQEGSAPALFSGGSLLAGGAARTDLIAPDQTEPLTRAQFRTLHDAFRELPDATALFPTHGGGSFCSSGAGGERTSTLGHERATNPMLDLSDENEFLRWFPSTFPAAPDYFFRLRRVNQAGPRLRGEIAVPPLRAPGDFARLADEAVIVDVRPKECYLSRHIPRSLSIPFRYVFATWLGWLAPENAALLLVLGDEPLEAVLDECLLVGYERFAGVLRGGIDAWERAGLPLTAADLVDARRAHDLVAAGAVALDVREPDEFALAHIPGAVHMPLGQVATRLHQLGPARSIVAYCGHGERAATAVSLLERGGLTALADLEGGFDGWKEAGYAVES
jgi:glyoxylase-like metal-dependent hydrolase (beta-lactamase superfamily II)/rhodanese-related sulfurtransferase